MLAEIFADPDHGEPYPTEDNPQDVGQISDLEMYSSDNHEEEMGEHSPEHSDVSILEEDEGEEIEEVEEMEELMGEEVEEEQEEIDGGVEESSNEDPEYEEEDDGSVIGVEPEVEDTTAMDDGITREPETPDVSSHSFPAHHHMLNTGSSSEADIWNDGQDFLTDDDFLELDEDYATIVSHGTEEEAAQALSSYKAQQGSKQADHSLPAQSAPSVLEKLDSGTQYLTYLPYAGITNQFYGILRALVLAKSLGRTLIIPPITPSSHDKPGEPQPWSTYFDIGTFTYLTSVKVIELHNLKDPLVTPVQSRSMKRGEEAVKKAADKGAIPAGDHQLSLPTLEPLSCLQTGGFGLKRPLDFTAQEYLRHWGFDLTTYPSEHPDELDVEQLAASIREDSRTQQLLCITNSHKISVPQGSEWDQYGRHFYFSPILERFYVSAMDKLREEFDLDMQNGEQQHQQLPQYKEEGEEEKEQSLEDTDPPHNSHHPVPHRTTTNVEAIVDHRLQEPRSELYATQPISFISIHARRDDFIDYCQSHFTLDRMHTCLPSTEHLAATLSRLQARNPLLRHLPVLVSTNERRPEELAKFRSLGWHVVDHVRLQSEDKLGGVFGPMMVDQILMARARLLIGVRASTFSRVGALRQMDWYNRRSFIL
ncbi:hypothetical protein DFQ26_007877 [Actinomortierella ambigua]|nr:hypothetical protein DFQ26_007877 [Actinomortierella ambigua]